jgi:hypothetical protein
MHPTVKLPEAPAKRLETFGAAVFGPRWRKDLANAAGETHRVVKYWSAGHCPADLDVRLLRAANVMIERQHKRTAVLKVLRDQLEQGAV